MREVAVTEGDKVEAQIRNNFVQHTLYEVIRNKKTLTIYIVLEKELVFLVLKT